MNRRTNVRLHHRDPGHATHSSDSMGMEAVGTYCTRPRREKFPRDCGYPRPRARDLPEGTQHS
eukprot:5372659-Heterocapsa_arctica.AAC.1